MHLYFIFIKKIKLRKKKKSQKSIICLIIYFEDAMYFPPLKVMIVVVNHKNAGQICRNVKETKCLQCVKKKKKRSMCISKDILWVGHRFPFSLSLSLGQRRGALWANCGRTRPPRHTKKIWDQPQPLCHPMSILTVSSPDSLKAAPTYAIHLWKPAARGLQPHIRHKLLKHFPLHFSLKAA